MPGPSAVALRNLVSQVRRLNITDDAEVQRCVQAIEEVAVDREAGERNVADITSGEPLSLGRMPRSA